MTPEQKIKALMLTKAAADGHIKTGGDVTADNVDGLWDELTNADMHWDYLSDVRGGEVETGLPSPYSHHYESKSVAAKMLDGSWVGWTYWYGGGKHGEPEAVEWMEDAYEVSCAEEVKTMTVQTFAKIEPATAAA